MHSFFVRVSLAKTQTISSNDDVLNHLAKHPKLTSNATFLMSIEARARRITRAESLVQNHSCRIQLFFDVYTLQSKHANTKHYSRHLA